MCPRCPVCPGCLCVWSTSENRMHLPLNMAVVTMAKVNNVPQSLYTRVYWWRVLAVPSDVYILLDVALASFVGGVLNELLCT